MTATTGVPTFDDAHRRSAADVAVAVDVDPDTGLPSAEAAVRLERYGPNELHSEPPPSVWVVGRGQLTNPMNIMLLIVAVASLAIGQIATGIVVAALVTFNVVMGTNQEMKAQASVDALAKMQIPQARVRRDGQVAEVAARELVPGDVVLVEAGDLVPADGRLVTSATLEVQEAALTGESAPVAKDSNTLEASEVALGDRTDMVFQNTQVTRGSAVYLVTATGAATQMGRIADMVTATKRTKSPLQQELDGMTKVFGFLAWGAVAIIAAVGFARGQDGETLALLCISTAIASDPDRPSDVRADDAVVGRATPGGGEGGREVAGRRRDPRRYDGHQLRQDRHVDDERDDGLVDVRRRPLVPRRGFRLRQDRRDPRRGRDRPARLHAAGAGPVAVLGRHRGR